MKIALLSAFYPYRGGIAQFSAMFYRALENEHDVKAYTFTRQYPNFLFPGSSQFVTDKDVADKIPAERTLDTMNPLSFASTAKKINSEAPDIFISQYWMTFFGPSTGGVHKRIKGAKRLSILHNVIPHEKRFFDKWANKKFLKHSDGFVVLSDAVLKDLLSLVPEAKYLRLDHPVYNQFGEARPRNEALETLGLDSSKKYLLFFGFIRDYKGLDLLIESMKDVSEEYELIVAGEAYGSFEKYTEQIDRLELKGRVHIYNQYISDDEVGMYFSAADVCVLPYKGATQSGITAIAHHFNVPIIATDVGGLKENTKHNITGLIVDQPESSKISEAIQTYFTEDLMSKFSANIQKEKTENTWENFAEKVIKFSKTL
ncbi:MAG: glycosyltransferase [Crocinitomicaceae bacterium]|nr:glycosyltransferase [Crocinitomicaceae bacterium]